MTLPLLISVSHAGLSVPPELADLNLLTPEQIAERVKRPLAGLTVAPYYGC